jgi:Mor family transcriptional regulator
MSENFERFTGFMRDLGDVVCRELKARLKLSDDDALTIGMHCSRRVCEEFRGELLYVPIGRALQISERDHEMYAYYVASKRNIRATAKKYDLGIQGAYKRIHMIEESQYKTRQGALFEHTPDEPEAH